MLLLTTVSRVWMLLILPWITSTPASEIILISLLTLIVFPGIGLEEKITVSLVGVEPDGGFHSDTRKGCHRLTLTTRTEDQNLACRVVFDLIWLDKGSLRSFDVAKFDPVDNGLFHRTTKDSNLASSLNSSICCLLETEDI